MPRGADGSFVRAPPNMCGFGFKCIVDWVPIRGKGAKVRNLGDKAAAAEEEGIQRGLHNAFRYRLV